MVPIAKPSERLLTQALRQVVERGFGVEGLQPSLAARNSDLPEAHPDFLTGAPPELDTTG